MELTTGTKTEAQSNDVSTKIPCTATTAEATSTGSRNFYCPSRTAANVVTITGTDTAIKLAEVVIAGAAWGELIPLFIDLRVEAFVSFLLILPENVQCRYMMRNDNCK